MPALFPGSVAARIDAIEESYEFMLAYAARGVADETGTPGRGIRSFLDQLVTALDGLTAVARAEAAELSDSLAAASTTFLAIVEADAAKALAATRMVLACPRIGSQAIDNLNASIHLRTLLTDLFLLDEIFAMKGKDNAEPT
jgi:hypothetical protein